MIEIENIKLLRLKKEGIIPCPKSSSSQSNFPSGKACTLMACPLHHISKLTPAHGRMKFNISVNCAPDLNIISYLRFAGGTGNGRLAFFEASFGLSFTGGTGNGRFVFFKASLGFSSFTGGTGNGLLAR